jgi:hypothetical protein
MRAFVCWLCTLSLILSPTTTTLAQTAARAPSEFALANTQWEVAYEDARLGEVQGLASIRADQSISGVYQDPRTGEEHAFSGVARLELRDGNPIAIMSLRQSGPVPSSRFGVAALATNPGEDVAARLGDLRASLTILETVPVQLELEFGAAGMGGLWLVPAELGTPMRAGNQRIVSADNYLAAGPEAWLPAVPRFSGEANVYRPDRDLLDGSVEQEQSFLIELHGIGLPDSQEVSRNTIDFGPVSESLRFDAAFPNGGEFGRDLTIRVRTETLPEPGTYPLSVNGVDGNWTLEYRDLGPRVSLLRELRQGEFEPMAEVYVGEPVVVQVRFDAADTVEGLGFSSYPGLVFDSAEQLHEITLQKVGQALFRSAPLACSPADEAAESDQESTGLVCADGTNLAAAVRSGPRDAGLIELPVLAAPSPLWDPAMAAATACRRGNFDASVSGVNVQPQVHAALILLRDQLLETVTRNIDDINQEINPDPVAARLKREADLRLLQDQARRDLDNPLFFYEVNPPPSAHDRQPIPLRDALTGNYEPRLDDDARQDYEQIIVGEAQGQMMAASQRTQQRLAGVEDCDLELLIEFGKLAQPVLGEEIKAKLMRAGLPGEAAWMPDLAARAAVDTVAGVVTAVADDERYRQMRTDFAVLAFTAVTVGASLAALGTRMLAARGYAFAATAGGRTVPLIGFEYSNAAIARFAAAANVSELSQLGVALDQVIDAQTEGRAAIRRAGDLVPVLGTEAYEQAKTERYQQLRQGVLVAGLSGAAFGLPRAVTAMNAPSDGVTAGTRVSLGNGSPNTARLTPPAGSVVANPVTPAAAGGAAAASRTSADDLVDLATRIEEPDFTLIQDAPPSGPPLRAIDFESPVELPPGVSTANADELGALSGQLSDRDLAKLMQLRRELTPEETLMKRDLLRRYTNDRDGLSSTQRNIVRHGIREAGYARVADVVDDDTLLPPVPGRVEDFLDARAGAYSDHLTDAQVEDLFDAPGDLTSTELIQKLDLMRTGRAPVREMDPEFAEGLRRVFENPTRPSAGAARAVPAQGGQATIPANAGEAGGGTTVAMGPGGTVIAEPFEAPGTLILDPDTGASLNRMATPDMLARAGPYRGIWVEDFNPAVRVAESQKRMPMGTRARSASPEQPMVLDPAEQRYIYTLMPDGEVRYVAQRYAPVVSGNASRIDEMFKHSMLTEGGSAGQSGEIVYADGRWIITNESGRYGRYVSQETGNIVLRSRRSLDAARDILQLYGVRNVTGQAVALEPQFVRF